MRIVFATPELNPFVPGGAGSVVAGLASGLKEPDVTIVLAGSGIPRSVKNDSRIQPVHLPDPDGTMDWYLDRSRLTAEAVAKRVEEQEGITAEFTDFEALAWWALVHRSELGLEATRIAVRIHGPVDAITEAVGARPSPLDVLSEMERDVLAMVDVLLVPSDGLKAWAEHRYGIESERILVAPPPISEVSSRQWKPAKEPTFIHFGRLTETKGVHDLVSAIRPVLDAHPRAILDLIGPDGWSLEHDRPMSEVLQSMVSPGQLERVRFTGRLDRDTALDRLMSAWAVVLPSRFESFCLAAHEARRAGAPVVVPDLPAFEDFGEATGALKYDGSVDGLTDVLESIVRDRSVVDSLADRPPPAVGDPIAVYSGPMPPVRHVASQSALATAASHHLEDLLERSGREQRPGLQRLLTMVPRPVARAAAAILPQSLKDWVRARASWWEEQARRDAATRREAIEAEIARGGFEELEDPSVSVVIPCYDQGQWVTDAVLSVFEQTKTSWEIMLVDDGSTDSDTVEVLGDLAEWPRVRLLRQENRGLPAARNAGMREARGEFLVPLDADDELERGYLAHMLSVLESRPDAAFAHCWGRYFGSFEAYWLTRPYNPYQMLLSNSVLGCALIRADAWRDVGGYDETLVNGHEDWDLWLRLQERGWPQVQLRRPLFRYRMRGPSMSIETLSGHERARLTIADRHPALYQQSVMTVLKSEWYPWVTVLSGEPRALDDQQLTDREIVACEPNRVSIVDAVDSSRGKFVVEFDLLDSPPPDALERIAQALEQHVKADRAVAGGVPVAWRRWVLHDSEADPDSSVELDLEVKPGATPLLHRGVAPNPGWMVPDLPEPGLRVIRQRPEEEGPLPDWV